MSISSISGTSSTSYSSSTNDTSSLEKQLAKLQAELKTENASKDDASTKEKKVAQLEQQIQLISAQITQRSSNTSQSSAVDTTKKDTNNITNSNTQKAKGTISASGGIDILV
ncbi:FlxA-like family protein [Paenibacillus antarcticus]|uniref:FlxA protein n=1 Tax=Paenibacillus antarcticus TaxID=253703 RepID=A0A168Q041_9BACL|nr:FlxA-like family protein [Paenibacillus antarcticus]OAB47242.1 hypothetical protein PBAT_05910 [Paenibacillus antarcticus]